MASLGFSTGKVLFLKSLVLRVAIKSTFGMLSAQ